MPTIHGLDTFAHKKLSTAGGGLYVTILGTPTIVTSPVFQGAPTTLQIGTTAENQGVRLPNFVGTPNRVWFGFPMRITGAGSGDTNVCQIVPVTGASLRIFVDAGEVLSAFFTAGGATVAGPTLAIDTWYWVELIVDFSTTTYTCTWRVNGVAQTTATKTGESPASGNYIQFNRFAADATDRTLYCGGMVWGSAASNSDFYGEARFRSYLPNADGTHNVGAGTFRYTDNDGGAFTTITNGTTVAWSRLDEWPDDQTAADDWVERQLGTSLAEYVEIAFADEASLSDPVAVRVVSAIEESASADGNLNMKLVETTTVHGTPIYDADVGGTAPALYKSLLYTTKPTGGSWTRAALNATKIRISSSNPTSSIPRVKSLLLDAVFPSQATAVFSLPWETLGSSLANTLGSIPNTQSVARVYEKTVGPTPLDDLNDGYAAGDVWIAGTAVYICISPAANAANWVQVGS